MHRPSRPISTSRALAFACGLALLSGTFTPAALAQNAPQYMGIDHLEFFVTDLGRSLAFYTKLFGAEVFKHRRSERRYLVLGDGYLALEERDTAAIDHVCFGIEDFDIAATHAFLDAQAIPWQDYPSGRDLSVTDRDGSRTQLAQDNTWAQLLEASVVPENYEQPATPVFRALAFDEIFLTVTNLEVDSLFYARLLERAGTLQAGSLWFELGGGARLRLTQAPAGQAPGLNYFAILVSNTDMEAAAEAVFAAGGIIETILPNGFSFWDPDGHRVLVRTAGMF